MVEPDAAVAIVRARGPEESVLLIRRAERPEDPWSGHWSFPGGRREPQDPDLLHTALRELEEECGIRLGREALEAALPPTIARRRVGRYLLVAPFLFRVDAELPAVLDAREAVDALWLPLKLLLDPLRHCLRPIPGLPAEMAYPAIELEGMPLWGFTYRLITDWLGLLPKPVEQAGFEAASRVLDFLLVRGLRLRSGWSDSQSAGVKTAVVEGEIPAPLVLAHFSAPGAGIPPVNVLEARPEYIRVAGLAYEEYFIYGSGGTRE